MSKIGKKTIMIPEGVSVDIKEDSIEVIGKSDTLKVPRLSGIKVEIKDNEIAFSPEDKNKQTQLGHTEITNTECCHWSCRRI